MAGINLSGGNQGSVSKLPTILISTAPAWGGPWTFQDAAIFRNVKMFSASENVDALEFATPYGRVYSPYVGGFSIRSALNLSGSWAAMDVLDAQGAAVTVFVGRILGEDRRVFGSDPDGGGDAVLRPKGFQTWTAFGGAEILRQTRISTSFWVSPPQGHGTQSSGVGKLFWAPGFNRRDPHGLLRGNRSDSAAADDAKSYVFGGTSIWTRRQAVDYLFKRYLNTGSRGPVWTLGGQLDALAGELSLLELGVTETLDQVLRKIIAHKEGIEFGVRPTFGADGAPTGYEVNVFTLTAAPVSFLGATIPANPNVVNFSTGDMDAVQELRVGSDRTHTVSRVRLLGDRVIVCASLLGPTLSGDPSGDVLTSAVASLIGKWDTTLEAAYKAGSPTGDAANEDVQDNFRKDVRFDDVYRSYGLPTGYVRPAAWLPLFDGNGNPTGQQAPYQDYERETLSYLPLRRGFDYTTIPATNLNPPSKPTPDFQEPFLIAEDRKAEVQAGGGSSTTSRIWGTGEHVGIGLSALKKELGIFAHASPNHRLAAGRGTFDGTVGGTAKSRFDPDPHNDGEGHAIDARTLGATIAWKTDVRFALEYAVDPTNDDGTVMEEAVPQAQVWWLAPGTIVGVVNGSPVYTTQGVVLRNDADLYAQKMAGMIARYVFARRRVDLVFHGWRPWLSLLGSVLSTVEEGGGQTHGINAPITSVELHGGENAAPRTVVRAGFAS